MVDTIRQTKLSQYELLKTNQEHQQIIVDLKEELEKVYRDFEVEGEQKRSLEEKVKKLEKSQQYNVHLGENILFGNSEIEIDGKLLDNSPITFSGRADNPKISIGR